MPSTPRRRPATRQTAAEHRRTSEWKLFRDVVLSSIGAWMLIHETLSSNPRPVVLSVGMVLVGIPQALHLGDYFGKR